MNDRYIPSRLAMMEYYRRNKQEWLVAWLSGKDVDFPFSFEEVEGKIENY